MQKPKMIVLALLGLGLRYGFEMEAFAKRTEMRQWAKIGMSTIYKALSDLEREGAVSGDLEDSNKGPRRKAYALTSSGKSKMTELIRAALRSDASVYSERIAGLLFAPLLGPELAVEAISDSVAGLEHADQKLRKSAKENSTDQIGEVIIDYYRSIYQAERIAMRRMMEIIKQAPSGKNA